jgi:hypothetical protein
VKSNIFPWGLDTVSHAVRSIAFWWQGVIRGNVYFIELRPVVVIYRVIWLMHKKWHHKLLKWFIFTDKHGYLNAFAYIRSSNFPQVTRVSCDSSYGNLCLHLTGICTWYFLWCFYLHLFSVECSMHQPPVVGFHILTCCEECVFFPLFKYQEWFWVWQAWTIVAFMHVV